MKCNLLGLKTNDYIVTPKGFGKITQDLMESEELGITTFTVEFEGNQSEFIYFDEINYTVHKEIKVYVVNYLDKVFQINFSINVNDTFKEFYEKFCKFYNLDKTKVGVVF